MGVLATAAGFVLVARCPEHADCDGVHVVPPYSAGPALYIVPSGAVSAKPTALERHVRALSVAVVHKGPSASVSAVAIKVDRVHRGWRAQLRSARTLLDEAAAIELMNQMSQLVEWRRQESGGAPGVASELVRDSILQLADGTAQQRSRVVAPRTEQDELASEANTAPLRLLQLHAETEGRLLRGKHVPSHAAEALALAVAHGRHGGAAVTNDEATDVGGLGALAVAAEGGVGGSDSPGEGLLPSTLDLTLLHRGGSRATGGTGGEAGDAEGRDADGPLLHLVVDLDAPAALVEFSQPVSVRVWVFDGLEGTCLSEVAMLQFSSQCSDGGGGRAAVEPVNAGNDEASPSSSSARWSRAAFTNVPRALVQAGRCFVVVQFFRHGPLRDDAGSPAGRGSARPALYVRPLGTAVLAVPAALARLPSATPHRPAPLELRRPGGGC